MKTDKLTAKRIEHLLTANKAQKAKWVDGKWTPGFTVDETRDGFWVQARGIRYSRLSAITERWLELLSGEAVGLRVRRIGDTALSVSEGTNP